MYAIASNHPKLEWRRWWAINLFLFLLSLVFILDSCIFLLLRFSFIWSDWFDFFVGVVVIFHCFFLSLSLSPPNHSAFYCVHRNSIFISETWLGILGLYCFRIVVSVFEFEFCVPLSVFSICCAFLLEKVTHWNVQCKLSIWNVDFGWRKWIKTDDVERKREKEKRQKTLRSFKFDKYSVKGTNSTKNQIGHLIDIAGAHRTPTHSLFLINTYTHILWK